RFANDVIAVHDALNLWVICRRTLRRESTAAGEEQASRQQRPSRAGHKAPPELRRNDVRRDRPQSLRGEDQDGSAVEKSFAGHDSPPGFVWAAMAPTNYFDGDAWVNCAAFRARTVRTIGQSRQRFDARGMPK